MPQAPFQARPLLRLKAYQKPAPQSPRPETEQRVSKTEILVARFPDSFFPAGAKCRPLAIGIAQDIVAAAPDIDPSEIANALAQYCNSSEYHTAIIENFCRINLAGKETGFVSPAAKRYAASQLVRTKL